MNRIGAYTLLEPAGRGAMGEVWRARGPDGQPVAVKVLRAGSAANPAQRRRFTNELEALGRLRHPNLVPLLDAGEQDQVPFLVLAWVEGESLAARLERGGPLDPRDAAELVRRLALALAACHAQGLLHRDLKPENVLLRAADGEPLLIDFGLVKDMELARSSSEHMTRPGQLLGTPSWWPPEQARGDLDQVGPRSDVYGLGALLYGALTGRPPHAGATLSEVLASGERAPAPPGAARPGVPAWLDALTLRALDPDPARRPASAAALAAALAEGLTGRALATRRWSRAWPAGAAALLVLLGAGLWWARRGAPSPGPAPAPPSAGPRELEARLERARAHMRAGHHQEALKEWERASTLAPASAEVLHGRGASRQQLGDLRGAAEDFDRAIQLDPSAGAVWNSRGTVRLNLQDLRGARDDFQQAVQLEPFNALFRSNLAGAIQMLGDVEGAAREAETAIAQGTSQPLAFVQRGNARYARMDLRGALEDYERAVALAPRLGMARYQRGLARASLEDLQGAIEDYTQSMALDPTLAERVHFNRGMAWFQLGRLAEAEADLDQALKLEPRRGRTLQRRGQVRAARGDQEGARQDLTRALELEPQAAWAAEARAGLEALAGSSR